MQLPNVELHYCKVYNCELDGCYLLDYVIESSVLLSTELSECRVSTCDALESIVANSENRDSLLRRCKLETPKLLSSRIVKGSVLPVSTFSNPPSMSHKVMSNEMFKTLLNAVPCSSIIANSRPF